MGGRGTSSGIQFTTEDDAYKFFGVTDFFNDDAMFQDWQGHISDGEKNTVIAYTGIAYKAINGALRNGGYDNAPADVKAQIDQLDAAISKFRLDRTLTVMRGSSADLAGGYTTAAEINANLKGAIVRDRAFMSTSAVTGSEFNKAIKYEITVPKGRGRGAFIAPFSDFGSEREFLLKRDTKFKVLGATTDTHGKITVKMRVVG